MQDAEVLLKITSKKSQGNFCPDMIITCKVNNTCVEISAK